MELGRCFFLIVAVLFIPIYYYGISWQTHKKKWPVLNQFCHRIRQVNIIGNTFSPNPYPQRGDSFRVFVLLPYEQFQYHCIRPDHFLPRNYPSVQLPHATYRYNLQLRGKLTLHTDQTNNFYRNSLPQIPPSSIPPTPVGFLKQLHNSLSLHAIRDKFQITAQFSRSSSFRAAASADDGQCSGGGWWCKAGK